MKHDSYSTGLWHECDDQILGEDGLVIFRATENVLVKDQHRANVQRVVACVNAFDGIETERLAGKGLGEFLAGEVRLNKADPQPDGSFGFTFSGFAVQIMAESFADQFRESGAVNYLELLFEHEEIGLLTVTMQRTQGLTPAQKLARAESERDELARQVSALQTSQDNIINGLGIKGDGPYSKLVLEKFILLAGEVDAYRALVDNLGVIHSLKAQETDHLLAYYKAQGAEKMFNLVEPAVRNFCNPQVTRLVLEELAILATDLRDGRKG